MSLRLIKFGLIVFFILGLLIGLAIIVGALNPSRFCGKSCATVNALINLLGKDMAYAVIAIAWIIGACCFGLLARKIDTRNA
jgi:hypothetical protein